MSPGHSSAPAPGSPPAPPTPPVDRNDLGFGSVVARQSRERLLNRDGSFNVRREGLGFFQSLSLYHSLLNMSWPRFLLVLTGGFLAVNFVFACSYFLAGPDALSGLALDDDRRALPGLLLLLGADLRHHRLRQHRAGEARRQRPGRRSRR